MSGSNHSDNIEGDVDANCLFLGSCYYYNACLPDLGNHYIFDSHYHYDYSFGTACQRSVYKNFHRNQSNPVAKKYYPPNVNVPGNQQTASFTSQNERGNVQQNPIPSMSQQAVSDPVTTTPSSVDLPFSGTITPQILDQTKVTRYERVPELARSTLKEGATQAIILQVIANLKSSSYHPYHQYIQTHVEFGEWEYLSLN